MQFRRWENFAKPRVFPTGNFPDAGILMKERDRLKGEANKMSSAANWTGLGPYVVPGNGGAQGRVDCIRFHPTNNNTFWIGGANGGLWKTTNGGTTWSTTTDLLPNISIADIAVDPQNPNNVYVATGDGYGYEYGTYWHFWGGVYTAGVMKSTDGGNTWNATGLSYNQGQTEIIQRLIICPANPNILMAATRNGIWRTKDAGSTWNLVQGTHVFDMEFNASNPAVVYASFGKGIYRSLDTGATWTTLAANLSTTAGRLSIAVTPANAQVIYAWCSDGSFYRSADGGATFPVVTSPDGDAFPYGYYDMALNVSPLNADLVFVGGLETVKSVDGGNNWLITADWVNYQAQDYVHADKHVFEFMPGTNTVLAGTDGGLFKTTDQGGTWTDLSNGLNISQYYRLSCSATNANVTICGQQDNGVVRYNAGSWAQFDGLGDGMECLIDYKNPQNIYYSFQYGDLYASYDGGANFFSIAPASGDWIAPFVIDPFNHTTLYAGYDEVYMSPDSGMSWNALSSGLVTGDLSVLMVAPTNSNYIYAGTLSELHMTSNGGSSWTNISTGLPFSSVGLNSVAVSYTNPLHIWASFSGYSAANKVFKSTNGGLTWTNISAGLPNLPVNCIVYEKNTPDGLYAATDMGVYYINNWQGWTAYNTGLPNVIVSELEIHYGSGKIRAATYGRGLWESNVNNLTGVNEKAQAELQLSVSPNPSRDRFHVNIHSPEAKETVIAVYNLLGEKILEEKWLLLPGSNSYMADLSASPAGTYFIRAGERNAKVVLAK